jgi:hypothetical protein
MSDDKKPPLTTTAKKPIQSVGVDTITHPTPTKPTSGEKG